MHNYTVGPSYCPKCGKELETPISKCMFCGYQIQKGKAYRIKFPSFNEEKEPLEENIKKKRLTIGTSILIFTLPYLNSFYMLFIYPPLYFLFYWTIIPLIILAFLLNFEGLWLFFSSLEPKFKGISLIILGLFLFSSSFSTSILMRFDSIKIVMIYLILIDIPIVIMLLLGFIFLYFHNKIFDSISIIIVFYSNFFYWIIKIVALGYSGY